MIEDYYKLANNSKKELLKNKNDSSCKQIEYNFGI